MNRIVAPSRSPSAVPVNADSALIGTRELFVPAPTPRVGTLVNPHAGVARRQPTLQEMQDALTASAPPRDAD